MISPTKEQHNKHCRILEILDFLFLNPQTIKIIQTIQK